MSNFKDYHNASSGFDLVEKVAANTLTPDITEGKGPFLAKVLRVTQITGGDGDLTWVDELKNNFAIENPDDPNPFESLNRVMLYGRITSKYLPGQPDYHAHIPEPKKLGPPGEIPVEDEVYLDLHDEFVSINETAASQVPKVGDFVWVDYLDKKNREKPVYVGPLKGVLAIAGQPPCGAAPSTPSSTFNQAAPAGGAVPGGGNAALLKGKTTSTPPPGGKYVLHGYKLTDFTKQPGRFLKEPYKSQLQRLVAGVEVLHWYLESLYPNRKIKIYDPKAATTWGHAAKSSHKWGSGLDFKATVDGKKISNTKTWAILIKLISTGKLPDGGVGFYQTNTGPNKGKSTTFGTSLPPSGCPHWDPEYPQPGETKHPKTVNPKGYSKRKWYWGHKNDKKVVKKSSTVQALLKRPIVPRYAMQAVAGLPAPDSKMPTWEQTIQMLLNVDKQKTNNNPAPNAEVPPSKNTPTTTTKGEKPEDKKKKEEGKPTTGSEPKKEEKKKEEIKDKKKKTDAEQAKENVENATKAINNTLKKQEENKKAQSTSPSAAAGQAAAAIAVQQATNCAPGQTTGGGTGTGALGSGPPQTGVVNQGTKIKLPTKGKPKALYSNENVSTDVYPAGKEKNYTLQHVKMFVFHETAGHGTSYSNAASRASKIKKGKMYAVKDDNGNITGHKPYTNIKQVHFWGGRAGDTALTTPLNKLCGHANWCNYISVGIEVINMSNVKVKPGRIGNNITEGYKYLHPLGNVGGTAQSSGKGNGVLKHGTAIFGKNRLYMLPSERQCRMCWDLIVWLAGPNRPHKNVINIPILFPATANHSKLSTGFKSSVGGGSPVFIWGRFNPMVEGFKTKPPKTSWKKFWRTGLPSGRRFKPKQHWQQGLVAHHRWHHSDGVFQEFYCLGRALGMSSKQAYYAAIGGLAATNKKNNPKLNAGRNNFTHFPDQKMVNYGKKIWGSNGPLNWPQKHASLVTGKKKYGKRDVANNKTKFTKPLA